MRAHLEAICIEVAYFDALGSRGYGGEEPNAPYIDEIQKYEEEMGLQRAIKKQKDKEIGHGRGTLCLLKLVSRIGASWSLVEGVVVVSKNMVWEGTRVYFGCYVEDLDIS